MTIFTALPRQRLWQSSRASAGYRHSCKSVPVRTGHFVQHLANDPCHALHVIRRQSRVDEEHEAFLPQFPCVWQRIMRPPPCAFERLLQIDLGTGSLEAGNPASGHFIDDPIPGPVGRQIFRPDIGIIFIIGVDRAFLPAAGIPGEWSAQPHDPLIARKGRQRVMKKRCILRARLCPLRHRWS